MTSAKQTNRFKTKHALMKERKLPPDEFMAAAVGNVKWLHCSLRDGHNPCLFNKQGLAPIHIAAMHGKLECLKVLIEIYRVDVNFQSQDGFCPLHLAINQKNGSNAYECVKYLITKGANLNCQNYEGTTPVHKAASEGMEDCLTLLLDEGAEVESLDSRSDSALDLARLWGKRKCARIIQSKLWDNLKLNEELLKVKAKKMKQNFVDLQREVLHQILNEQEFFGNLSYSNWLELKGFSPNAGQVNTYTNKKKTDNLMAGLISRLFSNGTVKDIARRMEKLLQAYVRAAESSALALSQSNCAIATGDKTRAEARYGKSRSGISFFGMPSSLPFDTDLFHPVGIYAVPRALQKKYVEVSPGVFKWITPWNPSTNLNTFPATDLKNIQTIPLSIKPDVEDELPVFPTSNRISLDVEKKKNQIKLKLSDSSGVVEVVEVAVPYLARQFLQTTFTDILKRRRPKEIASGCVHIFDIQRKRRPEAFPESEIVKHLKAALDGYLFGSVLQKMPQK